MWELRRTEKITRTIVLPYVHGMSELIRRVLRLLEICTVNKAEQ